MTPTEKQEFEALKQEFNRLKSVSLIPYDIEQALRQRLQIASFTPTSVSAKLADSENKTVDTGGGTGSETVLDNPDIFLQVTIANTVYYIPAFTS